MNRGKKTIEKKIKKKINKEIRLAQNPAFAAPLAEEKVMKEKEMFRFKRPKKMSKRTTPGEIPVQYSAPKIVHAEGKRWIKTLEKQNVEGSRVLMKKLSKKRLALKPDRKMKGW